MGFFDKLFGLNKTKPTNQNTNTNSTNQPAPQPKPIITTKPSPTVSAATHGINLSKDEASHKIDLRKHELGIVLEKSGLGAHRARVALVLDFSGSMWSMYKDGTVQRIIERILPLGLKFDDNGAVDIFLFSDGAKLADAGELDMSNFHGYVENVILKKWKHLKGATEYAPVMNLILDKYTHTPGDPAYVMFVTDGDNTDKRPAKDAIVRAAHHGIFWQFVGIGHEQFHFLEKLDTMSGRVVDNANFFQVNDIDTVSDRELYERMMGEFPEWITKATKLGIIKK